MLNVNSLQKGVNCKCLYSNLLVLNFSLINNKLTFERVASITLKY